MNTETESVAMRNVAFVDCSVHKRFTVLGVTRHWEECLMSTPTLGLDLDGLLDEANELFVFLSGCWPGRVVIVTCRDNRERAAADLKRLGIEYDELVLVRTLDAKAAVIVDHNIDIYFDDQPECLKGISDRVHVFLYRNGGNFNYDEQRWLFSRTTARLIDAENDAP